ncbi:MAG: hypothetical protein MJ069_08140 [Salinivirgaceae bacterium]|nr:hypothetical protein [Salinivirgaceae bacterium]
MLKKCEGEKDMANEQNFGDAISRLIMKFKRVSFFEMLITNKGVVALLFGLLMVYISYGYVAENLLRRTQKIQKELKELRAESITRASNLMYISKQSEVFRLVNEHNLGLYEAVEPPFKIIVEE